MYWCTQFLSVLFPADVNFLLSPGFALSFFFAWCIVVANSIQIIGFFGLIHFKLFSKPAPFRSTKRPSVTVVKACYSADDNEEENFKTFFEQKYSGKWELVFTVSNDSDAVVPIVKRLIALYPEVNARLLVSTRREAFWKKVDALHDAHLVTNGEYVIWSDSDVVVKQNYIEEMAASLSEPGVSIVTTPQYDFRINNFATAFKVIANNADVASFIMAYSLLIRKKGIAWGHSIGFKRAEFDSFGVSEGEEMWKVMSRFLADDMAVPYQFSKYGKKVVFRDIFCPVQYSNKRFSNVVSQKRRWTMVQKTAIGNNFAYVTALFSYSSCVSLFFCLSQGFSSLSLLVFGISALIRIFLSASLEVVIFKSLRMTVRWFWAAVLWDLSQIYFIIYGLRTTTMQFDGKVFRIKDRYYLDQIS